MNQDQLGNSKVIFRTLGASSHAIEDRQKHDYYATDPVALEKLLEHETFDNRVWECACGEGHLSKVLESKGYDVLSTDLIDRGYGIGNVNFLSPLETDHKDFTRDIITNPPYKNATEFVNMAMDNISVGGTVAMFLRIQFLESKERALLFKKYPPRTVYVFSSRINCAKNGEFEKYPSSAACYAWFVWTKRKLKIDETILKWI